MLNLNLIPLQASACNNVMECLCSNCPVFCYQNWNIKDSPKSFYQMPHFSSVECHNLRDLRKDKVFQEIKKWNENHEGKIVKTNKQFGSSRNRCCTEPLHEAGCGHDFIPNMDSHIKACLIEHQGIYASVFYSIFFLLWFLALWNPLVLSPLCKGTFQITFKIPLPFCCGSPDRR